METNDTRTLNPWFSMWTRPRATIQQIVDANPERLVMLVASLSGVSQALDRASMKSMGDKMDLSMILVFALVAGPIGGIVGLYIAGALLKWSGKWIGGNAPVENIRAAIAWSSVPVIWSLLLWPPELAIFGKELFTSATPNIDANQMLAIALMGFASVELVIGVWSIVVFLKCLGQVQGFSAWKALGNAMLAILLVVIPIVALILGVSVLTR